MIPPKCGDAETLGRLDALILEAEGDELRRLVDLRHRALRALRGSPEANAGDGLNQ